MGISSFAFIGIRDFVITSKATKKIEGRIPHVVSINLSDETAQDFLRGGYGTPKLLTLFGDRDCKLECATSTMSTELYKILTNNTVETKTKAEMFEEDIDIAGGKFTLANAPAANGVFSVFKIDGFTGKEVKPEMKVGSPATNETDYSITGKEITCHSSVTKIRVYYEALVEVETIEARDNTPKNYAGAGLLVAKEIETGTLYTAWFDCPNMTVQPSFKIQAKNDSGAPEAVTLNIDLMFDTLKGYPYAIDFQKMAD